MSNGQFTSLALNAFSSLMKNQGFRINAEASLYQGTWNAGTYVPGILTENTVLKKLQNSLPIAYANIGIFGLSMTTWRNLLSIGSSVCPALGNSRPSTFVPTYAGWGTWKYVNVDNFGNVTGSGPLSKTNEIYPPLNYGVEKTYSYIYQNYGDYAYITGWPGRNSWQEDSDDFIAAPPPSSGDVTLTDYDGYFRNGFIATIAQQAYYQFWSNYQTRRPNQYSEFTNSIQLFHEFQNSQNKQIASFANNTTFLRGTYSNINDLTTSDISGVNLAFRDFGNDLIRLGKSINLNDIHVFGLPSKLLITLYNTNALTESVKFALVYSDLSPTEITQIFVPGYITNLEQEKKIYTAFGLVQGNDLEEVKIIINCTTEGLTSLADLLNPLHMFPVSYPSLTIPEYSVITTSAKNYKLIYSGTEVNSSIENWGDYLVGILPDDIARACGAFMMTMNQVKNIRSMDFEKFSQVVANLEVTNKDLPLINSTQATPGDIPLSNEGLERIAFGSGNTGSYNYCDFLGSMSGIPYVGLFQQVQTLLNQAATQTLYNIYNSLYELVNTPPPDPESGLPSINYNSQIQLLINQANAEIAAIASANPSLIADLNYYWNRIGEQMTTEQTAIALAIKSTANVYENSEQFSIENFIRSLSNYALDTDSFQIAPILERIYDVTNIGGQSLLGHMREIRNAERIARLGGELDSYVPDFMDIQAASAVANVTSGTITSITITSGGTEYSTVIDTTMPTETEDGISSSRCECCAPYVTVSPQGGVFGGSGGGAVVDVVLDEVGSVRNIIIDNPGSGYSETFPPHIYIENPPDAIRLGDAEEPGSFAGSPFTGQDPISENLIASPGSSYTVPQAQALFS